MKKRLSVCLVALFCFTFFCSPQTRANDDDEYFPSAVEDIRKWSPDHMPLCVYIANGDKIPGFKPTYMQIAKDAFATWADATDGKVSFKFVDDPKKANIIFKWSNNPNDLPDKLEPMMLGETNCLHSDLGIESAVMVMLTVSQSPKQKFSDELLHCLCLHEVGHVLGLLHSPDPKDVMYCSVSDDSAVAMAANLTARDIKTIKHLYLDSVSATCKPSDLGKTASAESGIRVTKNPVFEKANAAANRGDFDEAIDIYQKLLNDNPLSTASKENLAGVLNNAGSKAMSNKQFDASIDYYKRALAVGVLQPLIKDNIVLACAQKGYYAMTHSANSDAETAYKLALSVGRHDDPELCLAMRNYALLLKKLGRTAEAAKLESQFPAAAAPK